MSAEVVFLLAPPAARAANDDRYRRCLGQASWQLLSPDIQRRFSKRLAHGEQVVYRGEVVSMKLSRAGWLLAQASRLLGAPLPFTNGAAGACTVIVTEDESIGGQVWTRTYPRPGKFPQVIQSAKRFAGPTGLEEYLGLGLVMRLSMSAEADQLVFSSDGYAWQIAGRSIPVPRWLSPGRCTVVHRRETDKRFSFTLTLDHALLGRLVHQVAFFDDALA